VQGGGFPGGSGGLVIVKCNSTDKSQIFEYDDSAEDFELKQNGHCVDVHSGGPIVWMYGCSSLPNDQLHLNATTKTLSIASGKTCIGVEEEDPAGNLILAYSSFHMKSIIDNMPALYFFLLMYDAVSFKARRFNQRCRHGQSH